MASVGPEELVELEKVLYQTVNFGLGKHVEEFENEIKKYIGNEKN